MKTNRLSSVIEKGEHTEQGEQLMEKNGFESDFQKKEQKLVYPQIIAAVAVMSNLIVTGKSFGYSAILVPQLLEYKNSTAHRNGTDDLSTTMEVSESVISWIVSSMPLVIAATSLCGIAVDSLGRLNAIKLAAIPGIVGWSLIAIAKNATLLIIGRVLTGTGIGLMITATSAYVSEISSPSMRGALVSLSPCLFASGIMLVYLEGCFLSWKTVAWISAIYAVVPVVVVILWVPESPTWLVSKNRIDQAKKSLKRLNGHGMFNKEHKDACIETQITLLLNDNSHEEEQHNANINHTRRIFKMFTSPEVYRPFLLLFIFFLLQQVSGIFVVIFYAVSVFMEIGINVSAYFAAALVGIARFSMSIVAIFLMKRFRRRPLLIASSLGMSVTIGLSGLFTVFIKKGYTGVTWIPVILIFLYVASSMIGLLTISWVILSEFFPTEVRGIVSNLVFGLTYLCMFAILHLYFNLIGWFGGIIGLQYFFAATSLTGALFGYFLLPETYNKTLTEIQEFFKLHWTNI